MLNTISSKKCFSIFTGYLLYKFFKTGICYDKLFNLLQSTEFTTIYMNN